MKGALAVVLSLCVAIALPSLVWAQGNLPPANFKIAFIGDQGLGPNAEAVLKLIKNEGANAVLHQGDFDYVDNPAAWNGQINRILGPDFPYFASVGNHDAARFYGSGGYQEFLAARMNRLGISWEGDLGVQSSFYYRGIFIVQTAPGIFSTNHDLYIRNQLAADNSIWRISSWHKLMRLMQVGGKVDETGWGVYEESRAGGAIIATGHEHSYSRTYPLSSFKSQTVASTGDPLVLASNDPNTLPDEGRSFAFVSGLGGYSVRIQQLRGDWWASIYTSDQGANFGALFGVFNYQGNPRLAYFYFLDIDGNVPDEFFVLSSVGVGDIVANQPPSVDAGPDQAVTLPVAALLDGTVTDDGLPKPPGTVTTAWNLVSGPGTVTFADRNVVDTTAVFSGTGTYVLRLTADDGEFVAIDEVTVTVNGAGNGGGGDGGDGVANQPPSVDAGPDQAVTLPVRHPTALGGFLQGPSRWSLSSHQNSHLPVAALLDGRITDDGLPKPPGAVTTTWNLVSGPGTVTFADRNVVDTTAVFSGTGTYVLRLTADDGEFVAIDEVTVTVKGAGSDGVGGGGGCSISPEGISKSESPLGTILALFSPWIWLVVRKTFRRKKILL